MLQNPPTTTTHHPTVLNIPADNTFILSTLSSSGWREDLSLSDNIGRNLMELHFLLVTFQSLYSYLKEKKLLVEFK